MEPRVNLWIEQDGEVVLSEWRVSLLEAIAQTGSISAAAAQLNVPYHRAWDKIHEMEAGLGVKLVETQTGGSGGGGAQLTPDGARYIEQFRRFQSGFKEQVERRFQETFQK
ncbi:MAG TPA: LysR family transcriptional regulator [Anaerolineae bacterium]|nr:LysR family transcriptional regulator [Anaerolineae bacterium]